MYNKQVNYSKYPKGSSKIQSNRLESSNPNEIESAMASRGLEELALGLRLARSLLFDLAMDEN
jgi:hypothetical protein